MFTVKASYRAEIRRITFDADDFPSFQQLCSELHKKFPTLKSFQMTNLLFSSKGNVGAPRILIGLRIQTAEDYEKRIEPYQGRSWPGAVLKIQINDIASSSTPRRAIVDGDTTSGLSSAASSRPTSFADYPSAEETPMTTPGPEFASLFPPSNQHAHDSRQSMVARIRERTSTRTHSNTSVSDDIADDATVRNVACADTLEDNHNHSSLAQLRLRLQERQHHPFLQQRERTASSSSAEGSQPARHTPRVLWDSISIKSAASAEELKATDEALRKQGEALERRSDALLQELRRSNQTWRDKFLANLKTAQERAEMNADRDDSLPPSPQAESSFGHELHAASSSNSLAISTVKAGGDVLSSRSFFPVPEQPTFPLRPVTDFDRISWYSDSGRSTPAPRRSEDDIFQEASERAVDLGLDLLRSSQNLAHDYSRSPSPATPVFQSRPPSHFLQESPALPRIPSCDFDPTRASRSRVECPSTETPYLPRFPSPPPSFTPQIHIAPQQIEQITAPLSESISSTVESANGWIAECEKLKQQIEDVQLSLGTLRVDFDQAVSNGPLNASIRSTKPTAVPVNAQELSQAHIAAVVDSPSTPLDPSQAPVVHSNVTCDGCKKRIIGVRYKCLECADFDLCGACLCSSYGYATHDAQHAFFPITLPGKKDAYLKARSARLGIEHPAFCDGCNLRIFGTRHKCLDCPDFDFCNKCISSVTARSSHSMEHAFFPIEAPWKKDGYYSAAQLRRTVQAAAHDLVVHCSVVCDGCAARVKGVRHKCLQCENFDLCSSCISDQAKRSAHNIEHTFFPIPKPTDVRAFDEARARISSSTQTDGHRYVICNKCQELVVGVRHKCLDCPDFDFCDDCVESGRREHFSGHQFFPITKPGNVIVHTVHEDAVPMWLGSNATQISSPGVFAGTPVEPVVHAANCNLCDSRIRGDRYKCLNCPNFDVCSACFSITRDQHPEHGFVKVSSLDSLHLRGALRVNIVHNAACNECHQPIRGTRYKCLHSDCADYDLCQNCEALPIPVHPLTHPLLKMKLKECLLPTDWFIQPQQSYQSFPSAGYVSDLCTAVDHQECPVSPSIMSQLPHSQESLVPGPFVQHYPSYPATSKPPSHGLDNEPRCMPDVPPLLPVSWTPPEIEWRWGNAPPGPMVVPHMLSDCETTEVMPEYPQAVAHLSQPLVNFESRPPVASSIGSHLTTPRSGSVSDASSPGQQAVSRSLPAPPTESRLIDLCEPHGDVQVVDISATEPALPIPQPVPCLGPVENTEWRELWPELTSVLRHLLQPPSPPSVDEPAAVSIPDAMASRISREPSSTSQEFESAVESPLGQEALLSRPEASDMVELSRDFGHNLVEYLNQVIPPMPSLPAPPQPRFHAAYVSDSNIAEGQIFPPGAEFVKSWRMRNDGDLAWPESTTLRYVAGDRLAPRGMDTELVPIGVVEAGEEIELVGGDMKAPEVPGKYVSYWRLHDGQQFFGSSVWVDIVVAEPAQSDEQSSDESLAASSVIMPPAPSLGNGSRASGGLSIPASSITIPSAPPSDDGSFDSSMSLINIPSSPSIDDDEEFLDSRSRAASVAPSPSGIERDFEYVVLYDTSSSGEE